MRCQKVSLKECLLGHIVESQHPSAQKKLPGSIKVQEICTDNIPRGIGETAPDSKADPPGNKGENTYGRGVKFYAFRG